MKLAFIKQAGTGRFAAHGGTKLPNVSSAEAVLEGAASFALGVNP